MNVRINLPLSEKDYKILKKGMEVLISGPVYTARDAAHKKIVQILEKKGKLPFPLKGSAIYYTGPSPAPYGKVIGSCGPTTSSRMDPFTPLLLKYGLKVMIGKGERSEEVMNAIRKNNAVYFTTIGGLGALLSSHVIKSSLVAWKELGPEAVYLLELKDFPCFVSII